MFPKLSLLALLAVLSSSALLVLASPAEYHRVEQRSHHHHVARNAAPANGSVHPALGRSKRRRDAGSKAKRCAAKAASSSSALSTAAPTSTIPPIPNNAQVTPTSSAADSTTWAASTTTTTTAAKADPTDGGSSSDGMSGGLPISKLTGDITYYGTGLGACGITNVDTDYIAAASYLLFDTYPGYNYDGGSGNPNTNPLCGKKVTLTYQGKRVTVTLTDRCAGCEIFGSLDLSPSAFNQICDPAVGRGHGMTWLFDE